MAMNPRDRRAVILGGLALGIIGAWFFVVEPVLGWYGDLASAHAQSARRLAQRIYERRKQAYQREQVRTWEARTGPLGPPRSYPDAITSIGAQIVAASQASGVELQGATPGAALPWIEDPNLLTSNIQVEGKADWENVFKFIGALYRIDGVLSIEQMDLNLSDPKQPGKLICRLSVSVLMQRTTEGGVQWKS